MKKALLALLILLTLTSCIFSDGEEGENRAEKAIYPDMVMEKATYQIGQADENPITMYGDKITFYSADGYALLENFSFEQRNPEGEITIRGGAKEGRVKIEEKYLSLRGDVTFAKDDENMRIYTDSLEYDSEKGEIFADGTVMIESKQGTFVGKDFKGDLLSSSYIFTSIEKGELSLD